MAWSPGGAKSLRVYNAWRFALIRWELRCEQRVSGPNRKRGVNAMPHFYFHLCDGESITDPVGKELPDLDAVQDEAVRSARLMISANVLEGRLNLGWRFDIRDA